MPRKIIIDTDPGVDDVLAILLALASPEVDVALITLVFGNTHAPATFANLLKVYYNLGLELATTPGAKERYASLARIKTRVAIGEDDPIGGAKHVATYFHGRDGLSNISETHPQFTPPAGQDVLAPGADHPFIELANVRAADAILELLAAEPPGSVTIVALGPLTNVAWAHRKDPATFSRVREVVWMGGALDVPGNTSPVAEFNCFADPYAAAELMEGVKRGAFHLTFAPLDITTPHTIAFRDLLHPGLIPGADAAAFPPATPLQAFTTAFLLRVRWLQEQFGHGDAMEMHDPVAMWYAIAHAGEEAAPGWVVSHRSFAIERNGEITRGMCVVDRRGTGETATDRTQDENLTSGNAHLNLNGTGLNKAEAAEDKGVEEIARDLATSPVCDCATNPDVTPEQCRCPARRLPRMISQTPGVDVLRQTLLSRVFGTQV